VNRWAVPMEQPLYNKGHPHTMFLKFGSNNKRLFAGLAEGRIDGSGDDPIAIKNDSTGYSYDTRPDCGYLSQNIIITNSTIRNTGYLFYYCRKTGGFN